MAYNIGDRIGDYQIIDVLGAGGMGKVYKVRNSISERVEAMKVLLPNLANDPDLADRFMREIKVQASLQHQNIASLHTALRLDNQLIMLIEFVEGSTIESVLRAGPIPVANAIEYTKQVLLALQYAHSHGVIHRDIKPANMMLTPSSVVKLMDFGIAKLSEDRRLTQTGRTVGSLYYMSPEQIQGAVDLDPRADLYSLGVSLYEMLTQTRPFLGDSDYSIMAAHLSSQPVPPIQIDPTLPPVLNDIILMAIAKDPQHRFQTAEAFGRALETAQAQLRSGGGITKIVGGPVPMAATTAPLKAASPSSLIPDSAAASPAGKSRRGLYMAIGSLVTVAVLAVAAMQAPKWFNGSAAASIPSAQQSQVVPNQTVRPEMSVPAMPSTPATTDSLPITSPLTNARPAITEPKRTEAPPAVMDRTTKPVAQNTQPPASPVQTQIQQTPSPAQQAAQQPPPNAPAVPAMDTAKQTALRDLRDHMTMLASRANSARSTLNRMKEQQARQGLGMRGDVLTAEQRMENFLDDAQAALRGGDPDTAKKALQNAEKEIDRLDTFLGR